jgi:two-component system response regulator NreC
MNGGGSVADATIAHGVQPEEPIRVMLADDHGILRDGLRALLEVAGDIVVVGEASTGREAVDQAISLRPRVVLMDISMPELDGVEACQRIRRQSLGTHVLFLSMHEADDYILRALQAGAAGYVMKSAAAADLVNAVRAVARDESFLSPGAACAVIASYTAQRAATTLSRDAEVPLDRYDSLTSREREVLKLVCEGYNNQAIADQLHLGIKTVQTHRAAVMDKLSLRNVTQLVRYAVRRGLVDPEQ